MHYQKIIDNSFCLQFFNGTVSKTKVRRVSQRSNFSFFSYKAQPSRQRAVSWDRIFTLATRPRPKTETVSWVPMQTSSKVDAEMGRSGGTRHVLRGLLGEGPNDCQEQKPDFVREAGYLGRGAHGSLSSSLHTTPHHSLSNLRPELSSACDGSCPR